MHLKEGLQKKRFVVTSEIQPPLDSDVKEILTNIEKIRGRLDGVTVPEFEIENLIRFCKPPAGKRTGWISSHIYRRPRNRV
jgi:hypothetical protein